MAIFVSSSSGSTGRPKGVAITHRNSLTFVRWAHARLGLRPGDVLSNHAPLHFDLSTFDLFAASAAGATVSLVPGEAAMFPVRLAAWLRTQGVVPTIRALREHFTSVADAELQKALEKCKRGLAVSKKELAQYTEWLRDIEAASIRARERIADLTGQIPAHAVRALHLPHMCIG